jgi:hypothetical protein
VGLQVAEFGEGAPTIPIPLKPITAVPEANTSPTKPSSIALTSVYPVTLASGAEIRAGQYVYKILTARLDRHGQNKLSLRLEVRMTNNSSENRVTANFLAASLRLLVDGVLRAPENDLYEVVSGHSAKEGVVEFVIPDTATDVGLQVAEFGEGAPTIPIPLKPTTGVPGTNLSPLGQPNLSQIGYTNPPTSTTSFRENGPLGPNTKGLGPGAPHPGDMPGKLRGFTTKHGPSGRSRIA